MVLFELRLADDLVVLYGPCEKEVGGFPSVLVQEFACFFGLEPVLHVPSEGAVEWLCGEAADPLFFAFECFFGLLTF